MITDNTTPHGQTTCQAENICSEDILKILEKHGAERSALIAILGDIQERYRYLPQDALRIVSDKTGVALVDVYAAATFYRSFSLKPRGKHFVCVCLGTACHVRGGPRVAEEFERQLGISAGETTPDEKFTLETVNCLGACALGPIAVIDGCYHSHVTTAKVKQILNDVREGRVSHDVVTDGRCFPLEVVCPQCDHSLMDSEHHEHGHPMINIMATYNGSRETIRLSGLYGIHKTQPQHKIPFNVTVEFLCPHCNAKLNSSAICPECEAPMTQMLVRGGARLSICSRSGCEGHMLDIDSTATSKGRM
jgi:NADH-quinone oxidoreductase subunit E